LTFAASTVVVVPQILPRHKAGRRPVAAIHAREVLAVVRRR
jgi:hypothetical protein